MCHTRAAGQLRATRFGAFTLTLISGALTVPAQLYVGLALRRRAGLDVRNHLYTPPSACHHSRGIAARGGVQLGLKVCLTYGGARLQTITSFQLGSSVVLSCAHTSRSMAAEIQRDGRELCIDAGCDALGCIWKLSPT